MGSGEDVRCKHPETKNIVTWILNFYVGRVHIAFNHRQRVYVDTEDKKVPLEISL
jgi:hypothetical protein